MAPIPADSAQDAPLEPEATIEADAPIEAEVIEAEVIEAEVAPTTPTATPAPAVPPPAAAVPPPSHESAAPRDLPSGPATRVHAQRLVTTSPKLRLTPSQAVRLASDGRDVLTRARPRAS